MLKIGHRGAAGLAPENTLAGIKKALKLGVDMIEIDVRKCKTGEAVLFHDRTVQRLTGQKAKIRDLTLSEVKNLRVHGEKIPTLDEVLVLVKNKTQLNIEVKARESTSEVTRLIKEHEIEHPIITSYDRPSLLNTRTVVPEIKIGAVSLGINPFLVNWMARHKVYSVSVLYGFIRESFVKRCHKAGIKVFAYPSGPTMKMDPNKLDKLGVDGAFYNYPEEKSF